MIRLATSNDFNFIYHLYMHPEVNPFLLYEVMNEENFRPIFNDLLRQEVKYVYCKNDDCIGMFKLIPLQHRSDHIVYLGGLAIHPSFSGKGEAIKMIHKILTLAAEKSFLRIELSVAVSNERAIHLYEKAGFQKEGILRKFTHLKSKQIFIDEVMMSYLF